MHTTEILKREHRLHARLLDGLEALLERGASTSDLDGDLVRRLFMFFGRFVDGLHQEKEERALFPQLVARIGRLEVAELERLEAHHQRDRRLLASLRSMVEDADLDNPARAGIFITRARAYVVFQRRHMLEEDAQLLPLVCRTLTPADDCAVRAGFRRLEHEHGISFEPEALRLLAEPGLRLVAVPMSPSSLMLGALEGVDVGGFVN